MTETNPPRRRSSRVSISRALNVIDETNNEDVVAESHSDVDIESSEDGDFEKKCRTPKKRAKLSKTKTRQTPKRKSIPVRKNTPISGKRGRRRKDHDSDVADDNRFNDDLAQDQFRIIDMIVNLSLKRSDLKRSVDEWIELYSSSPDAAVSSVMSLALHVTGCTLSLPTSSLNDDLNDPALLKRFQSSAEQSDSAFGLSNPNKSAAKKFAERIKLWMRIWLESIPPSILYESEIITVLIEWLTTLSLNGLRVIRLGACVFAFALVDGLIGTWNRLQNELSVLATSMKQSGKRSAKAAAQIGGDRDELNSNVKSLNEYISAVFQEIFVPRYRDVHHAIRELCVEALRDWILSYPPFASDAYLKYMGWVLNSSSASVRDAAVRAVGDMVRSDPVRAKISSFLNRFVSRIIEMQNDVDEATAAHAIRTCTTLLIHDDILADYESFGEMAPLLWYPSRLIREAAADYVVEDSFSGSDVQDGGNTATVFQADIDQLYAIFGEATPDDDTAVDRLVPTMLSLFFFKLACIRDPFAIVAALKSSADSTDSSDRPASSRSHFIAQLLLSSCEFCLQEPHGRLSKVHSSQLASTAALFNDVIADGDFVALLNAFQSEPDVFSCLAKLFVAVLSRKEATRSYPPTLGAVLVAALQRETRPIHLRPICAALAVVATSDSDVERSLQQEIIDELCQTAQRLQADMYEGSVEHSLLVAACYARVCCISQQFYCPILQEVRLFDHLLSDAVEGIDNGADDLAINRMENLIKIAYSTLLWGLSRQCDRDGIQRRFSLTVAALTRLVQQRHCPSLSTLACSVAADLVAVALQSTSSSVRECLQEDLFPALAAHVAAQSDCLETVKAGARLVCCFAPEHVTICATLMSKYVGRDADHDGRALHTVKAMMVFLRAGAAHVLHMATVETLHIWFRTKSDKEASVLSRRLALSYGVTGGGLSSFDIILNCALDRFILNTDDSEDGGRFLILLHQFVQRAPTEALKSVAHHIDSIIADSNPSPSISELLSEFAKTVLKRLSPTVPLSDQQHLMYDECSSVVDRTDDGRND